MTARRRLTVWWCDECGYGRLEKTSGVHAMPDPSDYRGRMLTHELRPVMFIAEEDACLDGAKEPAADALEASL